MKKIGRGPMNAAVMSKASGPTISAFFFSSHFFVVRSMCLRAQSLKDEEHFPLKKACHLHGRFSNIFYFHPFFRGNDPI